MDVNRSTRILLLFRAANSTETDDQLRDSAATYGREYSGNSLTKSVPVLVAGEALDGRTIPGQERAHLEQVLEQAQVVG